MIITQLLGGMGNQMFQYALGKHLALKNNLPLKLDISILLDRSPGRHHVNREFDLDIFELTPQFATKNDIAPYNPQFMTKSEKFFFHSKRKLGLVKINKERSFEFDKSILELEGSQYIAGLWQSYKYFEDIEEIIRQDYKVKKPLVDKSLLLLSKIKSCDSVCINIRRTDYLSVKQTADVLGFIGLEYYRKALEILMSRISQPEIFVFSDDIQWCREHIRAGMAPIVYVDHSYAGEKFGDYFQLMMACKHFIIPNSTFGWWAAWLNANTNKLVIAPDKWMSDRSINTKDLVPPSWISV